jgi:molybdate/tungstate transport system substrate-binding protein
VSKLVRIILILLAVGFLAAAVMTNEKASEASGGLIVFHAGSLAVPFKQICEEFNRHYPEVKIVCEAAGSRLCARKITDLYRSCDIIASADYTVIDTLLIPEYADWNIKFATNEIVIAFRRSSHKAGEISRDNWHNILLEEDVAFGRSDPDADPCGYRTVLAIMLAERFNNRAGLTDKMLAKDRKYIRPKEVDLLALLEVGELDYIFIYRSVAEQHELEYLTLPEEINLKKPEFADLYKSASIRLTGKEPGTFITKAGAPIIYGVSIPRNAPNRALAMTFLAFLLDADEGGAILERNGQTTVVPAPTDTFDKLPESLKVFALPTERY